MINFFRKLRKKMADENRPIKYIRYAIGEIVLVVIGILIALQINTWNQNRLSRIEENQLLKNIHDEFLFNKTNIDNSISLNRESFNGLKDLMGIIGMEKEMISKHNVDSLLFLILETAVFRHSENSIKDLVESVGIKSLRNEHLKSLIYEWTGLLSAYIVHAERREKKADEVLIPYLEKKYPFKDIDQYGALNWQQGTILKVDKHEIFYDLEFENILDDYMFRVETEYIGMNRLKVVIDNILEQTE